MFKKLLAAFALCVAMMGVALAGTSAPAGAANPPVWHDWGWINTIDGGVHVYAYDSCQPGVVSSPYCLSLYIDYDVWSGPQAGVHSGILLARMPEWSWITAINAGTPGVSPLQIAVGVHPVYWNAWPGSYMNATWTDAQLGCSDFSYCGGDPNGWHLWHNATHFYGGDSIHPRQWAQLSNQNLPYYGAGSWPQGVFNINTIYA